MSASVETKRLGTLPWWLLLVEGIVSFVIGGLLLVAPEKTIAVTVQFLGVYWLITGILSIVGVFVGKRSGSRWLPLLSGILGILAGVIVIGHPLWSTILVPSVLVIILGVAGILVGLLRIFQALRGDGWAAALSGAVSLLLGALLLGSPLVALSVFVSITAVVAVVGGIVAIAGAITLRAL